MSKLYRPQFLFLFLLHMCMKTVEPRPVPLLEKGKKASKAGTDERKATDGSVRLKGRKWQRRFGSPARMSAI